MWGKMSNKIGLLLILVLIAGCGRLNSGGSGNSSAGKAKTINAPRVTDYNQARRNPSTNKPLDINGILHPANDNADIRVNKYLWRSTLETLDFLPIEAADPFSGIIVMGWGRAPGSNTDFRATVLIQDPALEAGSLKVAMQKRRGPASAETNRKIEDAILTRARQLRIRGVKRR
jgi:hypothetical protein